MAGEMHKKMGFGVVLVACLVALFHVTSAATSHTVGGSTGWTIPSPSSLYSSWSAKQTFTVGDTLVFNFPTGQHTVAEVTKSDYDSCTTSSPISSATTGPAKIKITAGAHYYICTIPGHCSAGQKLAITATTASSAGPAPPPSSGATTSPAPSSSGGSSSSPSPSSGGAAAAPASTPPVAGGPSSSANIAPPPSSANVAGAGLVLPVLFVAAAFLFN